MKKVLIFGSGSIGNHLANACRKMNLSVSVTDISKRALLRMKNKIYPSRYLKWDKNIRLVDYINVFKLKEKFDLIIVGTPPSTHFDLMKKIVDNLIFEKLMIEKPLSTYRVKFDQKKLKQLTRNKEAFVGYNHSVSKAFLYYKNLIKNIKKKRHKTYRSKLERRMERHFECSFLE